MISPIWGDDFTDLKETSEVFETSEVYNNARVF